MPEDSTRSYTQLPGIHISSDDPVLLPLSLSNPRSGHYVSRQQQQPAVLPTGGTTTVVAHGLCLPACLCRHFLSAAVRKQRNTCTIQPSSSITSKTTVSYLKAYKIVPYCSLSLSLSITKSFLKTLKPSHTSGMKKGKFGGSSASNPLLLILHAVVWTKWKLRSLSLSLTLSVSLSFCLCLCLVHRQNFSLILLLSSSPFSHKLRKLSSISSAIPRRDDTPRCEISGKLVLLRKSAKKHTAGEKTTTGTASLGQAQFLLCPSISPRGVNPGV